MAYWPMDPRTSRALICGALNARPMPELRAGRCEGGPFSSVRGTEVLRGERNVTRDWYGPKDPYKMADTYRRCNWRKSDEFRKRLALSQPHLR
jgi:hypothetical protein